MENWSEARKTAEQLATFLKKLHNAEEIFEKVAEAESLLPKLENQLKDAEKAGKDRKERAEFMRDTAEAEIKDMNKRLFETEKALKDAEKQLKSVKDGFVTNVAAFRDEAATKMAESEKELDASAKVFDDVVEKRKEELDDWVDKIRDAKKRHEDFIIAITRK